MVPPLSGVVFSNSASFRNCSMELIKSFLSRQGKTTKKERERERERGEMTQLYSIIKKSSLFVDLFMR